MSVFTYVDEDGVDRVAWLGWHLKKKAEREATRRPRRPRKAYVIPFWEIAEMKKPVAIEGGGAFPPATGGVMEACATLHTFMTDSRWDDGTARELPTMLFFADSGKWKVCLSDRATDRVAFITGDTVDDVLRAVEAGLVKETLDWRPAKHDGGRRRN